MLSHLHLCPLPVNAFAHLTSLSILFLDDNQLTSLPSGIFRNNTALGDLYLTYNYLTSESLPSDIFSNTKLGVLWFDSNKFTSVPSAIRNLSFVILDLHDNNLISLPPGLFDTSTYLRFLYFHYNNLTSLPAGLFDRNKELLQLDVSNNYVTSLPMALFQHNPKLHTFNMSGNPLVCTNRTLATCSCSAGQLVRNCKTVSCITSPPPPPPPGSCLNISSNIDYECSTGATITLNLSSSWICIIPAGAFDALTSLQTLWLNNNAMTSLLMSTFINNTNLQTLRLDDNKISLLPLGLFSANSNLRSLHLEQNAITSLPLTIFANNQQLADLTMDGNVLVCQDFLLQSCACTVGTLKRNITHVYCYSTNPSKRTQTAVPMAVGVAVGCMVIIALVYFGVYYAFRRQRHHYTAIPSNQNVNGEESL